jgi:hypothetical protein
MWKSFRYAWAIVRTLIMIAIALGCFSVADNRVSTIIVALLILIYLQGLGNGTIFMRSMFQQIADIMQELRTVRRLLKDASVDIDNECMNDQIMAKLKEQPLQEFVSMVGASVIYLIVLWNLMKTVFASHV